MLTVRPVFWLLFFLSGALGLIYEVVELRLLHLAIGSSAISVYAVLSSFMAGMAIGSFFAGKYLDRFPRPLLMYALLEFGVAIFSLPFFFVGRWGSLLGPFFTPDFLRESNVLPFWRGGLSFLFLLPPSSFMGATLPALSRFFRSNEQMGLETGRLYALNTFGAVAGCFVTGFFLIDHLGVFGTLTLAILGSVGIGCVAMFFAFKSPPVEFEVEQTHRSFVFSYDILYVFAISGMAALGAETIWTRVLRFTLRTDVYAFSIMLSVFLLALAAGSTLGSVIANRIEKPKRILALIQAWIGITSLLSLRMFRSVATILGPSNAVISPLEIVEASLKSCSLMLMPVLGFGAVFPLVMQIAADGRFPARSTGRLLSANTIGAAVGPILAGFVLVPLFGTAGSLVFIAGINVALAAFLVRSESRWKWSLAGLTILLFAIIPLMNSKSAPYLLPVFNVDSNGARRERPLLWFDEGYDVSAGVFLDAAGIADPEFKSLNVNGISYSATSFRSRRYMQSLSYLPALLHPKPKRILVVCLGTGVTAGAAARIPGVEMVDVVELSSTILEALPVFSRETGQLEKLKHVHMIVDDARNYLQTTKRTYDIITAEPPPPREAGVVNLYTTEYYEILKQRLSPGGLAVQWVPLTGQSVQESMALIATFADSFPHVSLWLPVPTQLILVGSVEPPGAQIEYADPWWNEKAMPETIGFRSSLDLLATFVAANSDARELCRNAPLVKDASPVVEYFRRFGNAATGEDLFRWLGKIRAGPIPGVILSDDAKNELFRKMELEGMIRRGDWSYSVPLLEYAHSMDEGHLYLQRDLAITAQQREAAVRLRKSDPGNPEFWDIEARLAIRARDFKYAEEILLEAIKKFPDISAFSIRLSDTYRLTDNFQKAMEVLTLLNQTPAVQARLELLRLGENADPRKKAQLMFDLGDWVSAAQLYKELMATDPETARRGLQKIEMKTNPE